MLWYEQLSFLELSSLAILLDQSRTPLSWWLNVRGPLELGYMGLGSDRWKKEWLS
jgi:hypothetical protein